MCDLVCIMRQQCDDDLLRVSVFYFIWMVANKDTQLQADRWKGPLMYHSKHKSMWWAHFVNALYTHNSRYEYICTSACEQMLCSISQHALNTHQTSYLWFIFTLQTNSQWLFNPFTHQFSRENEKVLLFDFLNNKIQYINKIQNRCNAHSGPLVGSVVCVMWQCYSHQYYYLIRKSIFWTEVCRFQAKTSFKWGSILNHHKAPKRTHRACLASYVVSDLANANI